MKEQMTTTGNSAGISGKRAQTQFRKYLLERNMSERTITAYCYALKQFYGLYSQLTDKNLQLYKVFLIERYKPQTVNLRLRAMNCFVRYRESSLCPVSMVHVQQKGFLEQIISQADYEFLKQRLWEDGEYNYYFLIRLMAATGVRISELVLFDVEDVKKGYRDIYSKGNKLRRVYIPAVLQTVTGGPDYTGNCISSGDISPGRPASDYECPDRGGTGGFLLWPRFPVPFLLYRQTDHPSSTDLH